jgi:antitoxin ParD1/3/4
MNVSLTPQLEQMIRAKVESGLYNNASEVVREALRIMIEHEERLQYRDRLESALAEGFASLDRGEGIELTRQVWDQIIAEADAMSDDEPLDPLVTGE